MQQERFFKLKLKLRYTSLYICICLSWTKNDEFSFPLLSQSILYIS